MEYKNIIFRRSAIVFVFLLFSAFLGYLFRILLARHLSISDYGLFYSMLSFFTFILVFVELGMTNALIRRIVEAITHKKEEEIKLIIISSLFFQMLITSCISLFIFLFADALSASFFHSSHSFELRLMTFWFWTLPFFYFFTWLYHSFQRSTWFAFLETSKALLSLAFLLLFFFFGSGIEAPFLSYAVVNIALVILFCFTIKRLLPLFFKTPFTLDFVSVKLVLQQGLFMGFSGFGWMILTQMDTLMLTYFRGLDEVGLYQVAVPLTSLVLSFATAITTTVLYPIVTELWVKKKRDELQSLFSLIYKYLVLIIFPFAFTVALFSQELILIFFGGKYLVAVIIVQVLALGSIFSIFSFINNSILNAMGSYKRVALFSFVACAVNFILNLLMIPRYGAVGAAAVTVLSYLLMFFFAMFEIKKMTGFEPFYKPFCFCIIASFSFVIFLILFKALLPLSGILLLISTCAAASFCYLLALHFSHLLRFSEVKELIEKSGFNLNSKKL